MELDTERRPKNEPTTSTFPRIETNSLVFFVCVPAVVKDENSNGWAAITATCLC